MAIIRANFADLYTSRLALIDEIILDKAEQETSMVPVAFNVKTGTGAFRQDTTIAGFMQAPEKDELDDVTFDDPLPGLDTKYTPVTYELGYKASEEAIDDDLDNWIPEVAASLGISFADAYEVVHANIFNNGFTGTAGPDALPLFDVAHTLLGGGTTKNELTNSADLNVTSLQQALVDFRDVPDERGLKRRRRPGLLLYPFELEFKAGELVESLLSPEDANNAVNMLQRQGLSRASWEYLTDVDAWFLLAKNKSDMSLKSYWWQRPVTRHDIDFKASAAMTKIRGRFVTGWSDWRGVFGSPGI